MKRLESIFNNLHIGVAVCNAANNRIESVNAVFARILGYEPGELTGALMEDIFTVECMLRFGAYKNTISECSNQGLFETIHQHKDGVSLFLTIHVSATKDNENNVEYFIVNLTDVTKCKHQELLLEQKEASLKEVQKITKIGSWEFCFSTMTLLCSDEMYRIFEIIFDESPPSYPDFIEVIHPDDRERVVRVYHKSLNNETSYDLTHRLLLNDGRIKYVREWGKSYYDPSGNPVRSTGMVQDVTERTMIEKKVEFIAHYDALTGLPNRILAKDRAEQAIAYAHRNGSRTVFLFIDLDGFKTVNDSLGHSVGDTMLRMVTQRLKEHIRESDTMSRQGGDEFLLIFSDIASISDVVILTKNLLKEFDEPFVVNTHPLASSASIGIAIYPDHGDTFEVLLQNADTAMYKAKESGKNTYCFYDPQMNHNLIGKFKMQNDLKIALQNSEFLLYYQPQIDLAHHKVSGVEALIRWRHPQMGMIPPMSFIPVAESTGLIVQIGEWVIREACRQAALWSQQGMSLTVAVNISAIQFKQGDLEAVVREALSVSGLDPRYLELELTESILIHDTENIYQTVQTLKGLGIQLSIDDFGTGYSSLSYLKRFAVDKLKIDQSFVRDILQDQEDAVIVRTIIQMAKNLNLKTIAEGVENGEVFNLIREYGCDEVQGYHFAEPMRAESVETFYLGWK
ncbi:MAG: EAL domain-containing protein [Sulfuricurvum sp.]|jgi:diguanylate cyclase (GGDEF)-like protein/PAS domain S-box-containing protein|uniref:sensor domain-containing protein n=1 Tax=Sulfuricurvum sp. TaxID=2025608 RepID=UPI0025FB1F24|nr:EAL domain-containing protein [Sulfuricurvum sp.]MCK9372494.1 EAL domain-containing protein [Sulfuricurvum sp.]